MGTLSETVTLLPTPLVALLGVVATFGAAPGLILRAATLVYPHGHPRRQELVAELYAVKRHERAFWVSEVLIAVLYEGVPLRIRAVRHRLRRRGSRSYRTSLIRTDLALLRGVARVQEVRLEHCRAGEEGDGSADIIVVDECDASAVHEAAIAMLRERHDLENFNVRLGQSHQEQ